MLFSETLVWGMGIFSIVCLVVSIVGLPAVLIRLPSDYFSKHKETISNTRRTWLSPVLYGVKNILGGLLLLLGIIFLFTPGQGLITLLAGLILMDFPYFFFYVDGFVLCVFLF